MTSTKRGWALVDTAVRAYFCPYCGTHLELPEGGHTRLVRCSFCPHRTTVDGMARYCDVHLVFEDLVKAKKVVDVRLSKKAKEKLAAQAKGTKAVMKDAQQEEKATVDAECLNCNHKKAYFRTAQLRSADEGQTIFYECMKCAHKWSENT